MAETVNKEPARNWGKTLFDFFMLFLAVTLGFLADSYRDKREERQLAQSLAAELVDDLSDDSASFADALSKRALRTEKLEKLFNVLSGNNSVSNDSLYKLVSYADYLPQFKSHRGTYEQLTNAGYLNYFDKKIAGQLTDYYVACNQLSDMQAIERQVLLDRLIPFLHLHFHTENFVSWRREGVFAESTDLRDWDDAAIWQLHNLVNQLRTENAELQIHYEKLLARTIELKAKLGQAPE
jgi:hypothetical protein